MTAALPTCVGVVFGGASGEHAVSIRSATTVIGALRQGSNTKRFRVIPIYIDRKGRWWPEAIADFVLAQGKEFTDDELPKPLPPKGFRGLPPGSDAIQVWFPVLHGPNGEDGTVQGLLTLMQQPFVGSGVLGSALGMDKLAMKAAFADAGLPQLPFIGVNASQLNKEQQRLSVIDAIETKLGYPCFVKPANLGSSVGISKAVNRNELIAGLHKAAALDHRIVVEEGVQARELECAVLGVNELKASVVGEIRFDSDWYDYETKYSEGLSRTIIPAPLTEDVSEQVRNHALKACQAINAQGMARVDFFFNEATNQLWINEINTLPGFTSQSMYPILWEASGLKRDQLVAHLVDTA